MAQGEPDLTVKRCELSSSYIYTKEDLEKAFNAGIAITNHDWHMQEFHGSSCQCVPLEFDNFDDWFNLKYKKDKNLSL
jgi:hypothetical protein